MNINQIYFLAISGYCPASNFPNLRFAWEYLQQEREMKMDIPDHLDMKIKMWLLIILKHIFKINWYNRE